MQELTDAQTLVVEYVHLGHHWNIQGVEVEKQGLKGRVGLREERRVNSGERERKGLGRDIRIRGLNIEKGEREA